ncbi:zinc-dependent alcohol dehydrogenase [Neobacillus niacini]|uniref:zinc-dependent alcohol dehydrogenase n=1 Tax=Neobacillus niacini TaxID=86668 RepID=UPI00203C5762|nr:alcohol dehydrogenase catalytic domain-containing protein [Neobacillus niacini]MCM3691199.1 alcohol dehydrogenase catalytic domain-containing protein [Neobacillus niacini]
MKAIVKTGKQYGSVQVIEVPKPSINDDEVLVRIRNASICGSDLHCYQFSPSHQFIETPVIMGHESSGEIVEVGSDVNGYRPGDRVVIEIMDWCNQCEPCLKGKTNICNQGKVRGMHFDGFFAEYAAVKIQHLHKIPDHLTFEQACLVEPTSILCRSLLLRGDINEGELVLVTGPGPIGLIAAQVVRAIGAEAIITGTNADEQSRLPIARELGFTTINIETEEIKEILQKVYQKSSVDAVVECSGAASVVQTALEITSKGGSIHLIGLFGKPLIETNLSLAIRKEITIHTSYASGWEDFESAIQLISKGAVNPEKLVSLYPVDQAVEAFEDAISKKVVKPMFQF